eukprot:CAMPEP_0206145046 /NCGR_PEP_ID=MMETSP1473-20131121/26196_1 /ASSEMBLY_ACC=CAM_ASM_001109 /TAXON_ID=1461547 /ORGANISM="Stichococcus sp, Strain RCC1054" /LENGTH=529 /DNA_ID=CAMNT_0053541101 /DNA_START=227 /DNA_END=1812 /DNA_ORIENTATION=+
MGAHGRASAVAFLTLTALLASAIGPAAAIIKQTQLGEADWISQHVGKVARAEFAAGGRPRVYAATESNVVACLNLRDGSIVWRQILNAVTDAVEHLMLVDLPTPAVITLSGGGTNLRAWSMADGALLWEHVLPTGGATGSTGGFGAGTVAGDKVFSHEAAMAAIAAARAAEASSDDPAVTEAAAEAAVKAAAKGLAGTAGDAGGGADANATEGSSSMVVLAAGEGRPAPLLVAFTHGRVFGFDLLAGSARAAWEVEITGWECAAAVHSSADASGVHLLGLLSGGSHLGVARIVLQGTGARLGRVIGLAAGEQLAAPLLLLAAGSGDASAVVLTASGSRVCSVDAAEGESMSCQRLDASVAAEGNPRLLPAAVSSQTVLLHTAAGITVLQRAMGGSYRAGTSFPGAMAVSAVAPTDQGLAVAIGGRDGRALWTKVLNATDSFQVVSEEAVADAGQLDAEGKAIQVDSIFLGAFRRKGGQTGFRALVSLADATAAVVQQGVRVWARPEALAGVLRARFEELPATAAAAAGG